MEQIRQAVQHVAILCADAWAVRDSDQHIEDARFLGVCLRLQCCQCLADIMGNHIVSAATFKRRVHRTTQVRALAAEGTPRFSFYRAANQKELQC